MVVVWEEAESKTASKVAIAETATVTIVEVVTIVESAITETAGHPSTKTAAFEAATAETVGKAATPKAAVAAAKATAHATTSVAATTPASARQRHCWCSQTNGRNCQ